MQKSILMSLLLITACAVDADESLTQSASTCDPECEHECPPPPPDGPPPSDGPSCTAKGVLVLLDEAPANVDDNDGKVTYCHATSAAGNPYVVITTSVNACFAHVRHEHQVKGGHLDIFPTGGCAD